MRVLAGVVCTIAALLLVSARVSDAAEPAAVRAALKSGQERKPAPMFQLNDRFGSPVKLSDYRGKVLLLNFWATWCGGCKKEMPRFQQFATAFGPRGFSVLGVSVDEDGWAAVNPYLEKTKLSYRMALAERSTTEDYRVTSMPATFIIDRNGRIAATYVGLVDRSDIEANLETELRRR